MKIRIMLLLLPFLCSCGFKQTSPSKASAELAINAKPIERIKGNSIYFWKTTFRLNTSELEFLERYDIRRLYVRFFDVALDGEGIGAQEDVVPIATTKFIDTLPCGVDIVPTVYITLEAMRKIKGKEADFAHKIITRVQAMAKRHKIDTLREVQLDCDWTAKSQSSYFALCSLIKDSLHKNGIALSSTIRLHQLKGAVPPVDFGVLMLYNTGALKNETTENSIIDYNAIVPYFRTVNNYAIPLDFAYPTFSWGVWFRDGKFMAILRTTNYDSAYYSVQSQNNYRVVTDHRLEGHKLQKGDVIRIENSPYKQIIRIKKLTQAIAQQNSYSVILYHLDSANLSKYSTDEIHSLYSYH